MMFFYPGVSQVETMSRIEGTVEDSQNGCEPYYFEQIQLSNYVLLGW